METKYLVLSGPHYPSGVSVEPTADSCLLAQFDDKLHVLLAFTVPHRPVPYSPRVLQRKRLAGKRILERYAEQLNGKMSAKARAELLNTLAAEREVQITVAAKLTRPKKPVQKPVSFGANFGNVCVGEREGSFSPPGRLDSYW